MSSRIFLILSLLFLISHALKCAIYTRLRQALSRFPRFDLESLGCVSTPLPVIDHFVQLLLEHLSFFLFFLPFFLLRLHFFHHFPFFIDVFPYLPYPLIRLPGLLLFVLIPFRVNFHLLLVVLIVVLLVVVLLTIIIFFIIFVVVFTAILIFAAVFTVIFAVAFAVALAVPFAIAMGVVFAFNALVSCCQVDSDVR